MNIRLDGKRALVNGNSGIGEAVALGLAQAGARVAGNYVAHAGGRVIGTMSHACAQPPAKVTRCFFDATSAGPPFSVPRARSGTKPHRREGY